MVNEAKLGENEHNSRTVHTFGAEKGGWIWAGIHKTEALKSKGSTGFLRLSYEQ